MYTVTHKRHNKLTTVATRFQHEIYPISYFSDGASTHSLLFLLHFLLLFSMNLIQIKRHRNRTSKQNILKLYCALLFDADCICGSRFHRIACTYG